MHQSASLQSLRLLQEISTAKNDKWPQIPPVNTVKPAYFVLLKDLLMQFELSR